MKLAIPTIFVFLFLISFNSLHAVQARTFQIDLSTGTLIDPPSDTNNARRSSTDEELIALWPQYVGNQLECTTTVDAEYSQIDGTYKVNFWYFKERITGPNSAYAVVVHIADLETFVANSFYNGVWDDGLDCSAIISRIWEVYQDVIQPTGMSMVHHLGGMVYSYQCVQWTNDQLDIINDLYHICTTTELKEMLESTNFPSPDISFSS